MKAWLSQPLIRFLFIGALLFAVDAVRNPVRPIEDATIDVGPAQIDWMVGNWTAQFGRTPSKAELQTIIDTWIVDEMRYREALALKLDRDDEIVRRRLVQKHEFLFSPETVIKEPDEAALRTHFDANRDKFKSNWAVSFCHIYFEIGSDRQRAFQLAKSASERLAHRAADDGLVRTLGDEFPHNNCYKNETENNIRRDFGDHFTQALNQIEIANWVGPVESGLGFHIVWISGRNQPEQLEFDVARPNVRADWMDQQQSAALNVQLGRLRARYRPTVNEAAIMDALKRGDELGRKHAPDVERNRGED